MQLIEQMQAQFAVTLCPNLDRPSLDTLRTQTKRLHAVLDQLALGRWFYQKPAAVRSEALWVTEHLDSNGHTHGALRVPDEWRDIIEEQDLEVLVREAYQKIAPRGKTSVARITDDGWSYYETKTIKVPSLGAKPWPTQSRTSDGRLIEMNRQERQQALAKIDMATQGIWLGSEFHSGK